MKQSATGQHQEHFSAELWAATDMAIGLRKELEPIGDPITAEHAVELYARVSDLEIMLRRLGNAYDAETSTS